jgi:hypothetical protein
MEVKRELLEQAVDKLLTCWPKSDPLVNELRAALSAPERKPMTLDEIKSNPVISYFGVESGEKIVRAVEAFHGIKEQS